MKLREEVEPRLEVVASEPRLDVREPRLLPDEQDRVLADRLDERGSQNRTSYDLKKKCFKVFQNLSQLNDIINKRIPPTL